MRGLAGRAFIVAGGGGIGNATAIRLCEEGAEVLIADLDESTAANAVSLIEASGGRAAAQWFDIRDEASVISMCDAAMDIFGRIDGVHVNAAELEQRVGPDTDVVDEALTVFDHAMDVNMRGHFLVTRHAVPRMLQTGGGSMVFTSSLAAFHGSSGGVAYQMSKAGVNALVRHVAKRWGQEGIRANGIAPGMVLTERVKRQFAPEAIENYRNRNPSGRAGEPSDLAAVVAFLLSTDAGWINGQVIAVDGGQSTTIEGSRHRKD